jgi:hypothetical protein
MEEKGGCMEEIGVNQERPSGVLRKVQKLWNRLWIQGNP